MSNKTIYELDEIKAKAMDCLQKRQKPEATNYYVELNRHYKQQSAYPDAKLAVLFNMLLSSLDQQTESYRNQIESLCLNMIDDFKKAKPSYLTSEIAKRIQILMQEPINEIGSTVAYELLEAASQHYHYVSPVSTNENPIILDHCIRANTIAQLYPEDSAFLCFLMIFYAKNKESLSSWLHPLLKLFLSAEDMPYEIEAQMQQFQKYCHESKFPEAYQVLLSSTEWAIHHHPLYASEWLIGLDYLEDIYGQHLNILNYKPLMPKEKKVILNIQFHLKLAQALSDEAGAERLALHHWHMVKALCEQLKNMIAEREKKFSAHSSEVDKKAKIAYWMALSQLAQGEFQYAQMLLHEYLDLAKRRILKDLFLQAELFYLNGSLLERQGFLGDASQSYMEVVQLLCPKLFTLSHVAQIPDFCDQYIEYLSEKGHIEGNHIGKSILILFQSIAGLLRLGLLEYSPLLLHIYRSWLYYFRYALGYQEWTESLLHLELAACYCQESKAPLRALEIARAINHRSAIVLSLFYQILEQIDSNPEDVLVWQRLNQDFKRLILEAKKAGGGHIQRMANLAGILLQLKKTKLENIAPTEDLENQISSVLELIQDSILSDYASPLDVYLPMNHRELNLEAHIIELIKQVPKPTAQENSYVKIAKFLCTISKGLSKHFHHVTPHRDFADKVRMMHHMLFTNNWLDNQLNQLELYKLYDDLLSRRETARWTRRHLHAKEIRIEYQVFEDSFVVFLIKQHQIIQAKQVIISKDQLNTLVFNYRNTLLFYPDDLSTQSTNLYGILLGDFDQEISSSTRLVIVPDGPLKDLPFSTLINPYGFQYLAQRIEIAIACPTTGPVFASNPNNGISNHLMLITQDNEINRLFSVHDDLMIDVSMIEDFIRSNNQENLSNELQMVYLQADIDFGPTLLFQNHRCPLGDMIKELANRRVSYAVLDGPVYGELGHTTVRALLTSLYLGLIAKQWNDVTPDCHRNQLLFLKSFFMGALKVNSPVSLIEALNSARRIAISEKMLPRDWANFEIYISERQ